MKKQKRRKLRIKRLFLLIFILFVISFLCVKFVDIPIKSIVIKGNEILTDQEIINESSLQTYPSYFGTFSYCIRKKILKNPYIESVKVTKGILRLKILVKEKKILYIDYKTGNKVTKSNEINDKKNICVPYLISDIPNNKKDEFIKAMDKIDKDILCKMSQIKYDPNEIDEDRYFVYMNDGNCVYLTINKFEKLNKYNTILENVGKQNGILYLDYGDYFELK